MLTYYLCYICHNIVSCFYEVFGVKLPVGVMVSALCSLDHYLIRSNQKVQKMIYAASPLNSKSHDQLAWIQAIMFK